MNDPSPSKPRSVALWLKVVVGVLHTLQALSLVPWLMMAGFAFMAFDAPGSTELLWPWVFVIGVWSYPFWIVGLGFLAWTLIFKGRPRLALLLAGLTTLPIPIVVFILSR